ncbi:ftsJ-like methyltransferase domain-containing protein [Ditylenchus destructor]|nr:ftsJ-like methyltransferase domain-containing protein [Ditylenchus destructor]
MDRLRDARRNDIVEEYRQDRESYGSKDGRKRSASELSSDDDEHTDNATSSPPTKMSRTEDAGTSVSSGIGWNLMRKSGYKEGAGLGRSEQGRVAPVEAFNQPGRIGLGHEAAKVLAPNEDIDIDTTSEIKTIEEKPLWLACSDEVREEVRQKLDTSWIVESKPKRIIDDEDRYCSREIISEMIECKNVFDHFDNRTLNEARARANPYETVKAGFFQNRAAMKTANLDKIFDWRLSRDFDEKRRLIKNPLAPDEDRENVDRESSLFYFADVCAGPGGFSEYMLWRKAFYNAKGFGFTLKNKDDFKLFKFKAAPPEYFETYYGEKGDGNVMDPNNLSSLENFVKERCHGTGGVHLVMCDGGFSVEGQENIQEILSKRLYLCQFIVGLSLCRTKMGDKHGGNFLCKLFDLFTPFSMGLVYLMYTAFEKISLHKPLTSRPANSERYIFCEGLTEFGATIVKDYMVDINNRLDRIAEQRKKDLEDIYEVVPTEIIEQDLPFFNYVKDHNEFVANRQIYYLKKYRLYAQNKGAYDSDQGRLRDECLKYWQLPNKERFLDNARNGPQRCPPSMQMKKFVGNKITWSNKRTLAFDMQILKENSEKHLPSAELRAVLLPDAAEPEILLTNGGNEMITHDRAGRTVRLPVPKAVCLPTDSILLIQRADKYDENFKPVGKLVYVIDACVLNGDDVSQLPYRCRLLAAKKFCAAVNKVLPSNASNNDRNREYKNNTVAEFEFVVAEQMRLNALAETKFETKQHKGAQQALFTVSGENDYKVICRGVRFVNILRANWSMHWSRSSREEYLFDGRSTTRLADATKEAYSTFYDCYNSCDLQNGDMVPRSWFWNWDMQYDKGFGVLNIIHDEHRDSEITLNTLSRELARERQRIEI